MIHGDLRDQLKGASRPIMIAVAGDSGSGKTTYTRGIERLLGGDVVSTLSLDGYHKEDRGQRRRSGRSPLDPRANHLKLAREHLTTIRGGAAVEVPVYNHQTGGFDPPRLFRPAPVVLVEGLHAAYPEFLPLFDLALFVDSDRDVRWRWKFERDVFHRGYDPEDARREMRSREIAYKRWIDFQKTNADIIIKIHESELASLAVEEYKGQIPDDCYHMEIVVSPTEAKLPSLHMPTDLNNMTRKQAMPFMLATVPSSYWGKPVNVVHVDGVMPAEALQQLETEILRLTGLKRPPAPGPAGLAHPSTVLFTQLLVAWPVIGHIIALLNRRRARGEEADARHVTG